MQFYDADRVHALLGYEGLVPALAEHHLRDVDAVGSLVQEQPTPMGETANFLALPAWQNGRALGAKLVTVFPDNEKNGSGLPSVQAVFILFDGETGSPSGCIDGTALTLRKTAGDSALGTSYLARQSASRLLMVGAGALAPHLIMAHCAVRPQVSEVHIWNRSPERAERVADTTVVDGVTVTAVTDIEASAREADIISCATMATDPLILGEWLKPGAHLDLVGSFRPDMHECDEAAMLKGSVFTDSPWSALRDCGEITSAFASGALTKDDIKANLFDLARGKHAGRSTEDEITVFQNGGGGHLDLMVSQYLCTLA